eukprot:CAMPEP_0117507494 /NCGR_PEP_ID=MMETSP0784-20121206/26450_1 /TAXON_ID=39447 /ORGANISM="" /LENGTH=598 /DNA_ID=CAMNT_0005302995 /DNA_START=69 /DNA_END=1860 /DNA_ORIENTATION=-
MLADINIKDPPPSVWSAEREQVSRVLHSAWFNNGQTFVILLSIWLLILESDAAAAGDESPLAVDVASNLMLLAFVAEIAAHIFVLGSEFFADRGRTADFCLVLGDIILTVLHFAFPNMPSIAVFRCLRLFRLARVVWLIQRLPELNFLLRGMASAAISIFWGLVMVSLILLTWALVAVQLFHPINLRLQERGVFEGTCERCPRAFSSVWNAIVTFTQTLLCGDSWGSTAIPVIEEEPWTLPIFVVMVASVTLAALNLILAAIVDCGAQAREGAREMRNMAFKQNEALEKERQLEQFESCLHALDDDCDGFLTKEELVNGFDCNSNFRSLMTQFGFEKTDVEVCFNIMDSKNESKVEIGKFYHCIQGQQLVHMDRMLSSIRRAVMDTWRRFDKNSDRLQTSVDSLTSALQTHTGKEPEVLPIVDVHRRTTRSPRATEVDCQRAQSEEPMKNVLVKLEPGLVDQYAQGTERDGAREAKQLKQELARTMRMVVEQAEANTKYLVDFERRVSAFADRDDALQRGHTSKGGDTNAAARRVQSEGRRLPTHAASCKGGSESRGQSQAAAFEVHATDVRKSEICADRAALPACRLTQDSLRLLPT